MPRSSDPFAEFGVPVETIEETDRFQEFGAPVDPIDVETPKTVLDERSGKSLEVPGFYSPSQIGAEIAKTFHPEKEDMTELGRNWMRDQLKKVEVTGRVAQYFADHIPTDDVRFPWGQKMRDKFQFEKDFEKRIAGGVDKFGDLLVDFAKEKQKSWKIGGVEVTAPNYEIMQGSFQENPSWTRAAALVASGFDSVLTGLALGAIGGGTPVLPAVYFGVTGGAETYGKAKDADKPQWIADSTAALSFFNNAILGYLPMSKYLEGAKGKLAGAAAGLISEGITEPLQQFIDNAITKIGIDDTQDLMEGVVESLFVGAFTGGIVGGFTSHSAKKVDAAIQKLKLAGFTDKQIEDMHYNTAVHIVENSQKPIFPVKDAEGNETKANLDELIMARLQAAKLRAETEGKYTNVEIKGPEDISLEEQATSAPEQELEAYHGTKRDFDQLDLEPRMNEPGELPDRMLGTHFAKDAEMANWFATDRAREPRGEEGGRVYKNKLKGKVYTVRQIQYESEEIMSDQAAIGADIAGRTIADHPEIFKRWAVKARNLTEEQAQDLYERLAAGETISKEDFPTAAFEGRELKGFTGFFANYDALLQQLSDADRQTLVRAYKDKLIKAGFSVLSYQNTSPEEARGVKDKTVYIPLKPEAVESFYSKRTPSEAAKAEPATPEQIAEPIQQVSEEPTSPEVLETGLPPIVTDLQTVTAKINDFRSKNQPVPESLLTRHRELINVLEGLRSSEQAQPNPGIKKIIRQATGQVELAPKTVTEMSALKAALHSASKAAAEAVRYTERELTDLKKGLVDQIKTYLPVSKQRGDFLGMIASAKDGADIVKVMDRLERSVEDYRKKALLSEIKKQIKKIEASSVIAIDYVQRIRDLLDMYEMGMTPEIRAKLEKTQEYIDRQRAAGKDVFIPQALLYQIKGLHRQSINALDSNALQNLLNQIVFLRDLGKVKLRAKQALYEARKAQALVEIAAGSKKMETRLIESPRVGEELSDAQVRRNVFRKSLNFAQAKNLAITPMDVVFDMLDGDMNYTGSNYRIFKSTIDRAFSNYLQKWDGISGKIVKLTKKLGLEKTDLEVIGFYAAKVQEGGVEKLEALGYTQEEIAAVELSDTQKELYTAMREELDRLRPEIEEVMRDVYNAELSDVADYFPFVTDFEAMSDLDIQQRFMAGAPETGQFKRVNVEKGFTLKRTGGKQKIKLNALEVFLQHLDNASYLVTVGRHTKFLSDIARSPEYTEAVGDKGQMVVVDWLDTIARKGRKQGDKIRVLDLIRKNIGLATLGFRLSSVLIQPSSIMDGAGLIGPVVFEGAHLIATSKEYREFVIKNMPEVRDRIGDDPFYLEFGENSVIDKTGRAAFWALQSVDRLTASSVALGAYIKYLREQGKEVDLANPDPDAIEYAQRIMRRSQASAFFKDAPQALSRGNLTGNSSLDRLVLQFQTFMLNRWSMLMHDGIDLGFKKGQVAKGLNVVSFLLLAKLGELGMRRMSKELMDLITGDDTEDDDILPGVIMSLLEDIPFVGQGVSAFMYGSVPVPALQIADKTFERLGNMVRAKKDATRRRAAIRAMILLSGLAGVPGATQLEQIVGNLTAEDSGPMTPAKILAKQRK